MPGLLFAGELTAIRVSSGPLATRVVLDLDGASSHRIFELTDPNRVVIDLPATETAGTMRLPDPKGRIRAVRTGARPGGELRVVLELTEPAVANSFPLDPEGGFGHRVVIDLSSPRAGNTASHRVVDTYTGRDLVIAIDAGHGGHDPGTDGYGVREKDVVLQIARRLYALVASEPGLRPVLIRDGDHYVELADRVRLAHEAQADFFISIHADSEPSSRASGATVYSLSTGRASSEAAKRLANRENGADLIGGVSLADVENAGVARVLLDLSQSASMSKSLVAGDAIIEQLSRVTLVRKTTVQQAGFLVLTSPDIPSLLVETAYLSNSADAAKLRDAGHQQMLARALFNGIVDFFRVSSPPESYFARNPPPIEHGPVRHVISRGETLSEIAERYRISLRELRRTNAIVGDVIRIGQVLTIPTTG